MPAYVPPTDPSYPDLSDLSLSQGTDRTAMLVNNRNTALAQIRVGNYNLTIAYLHGPWANYVLRMTSGQTLTPAQQQPPAPPMALVLSAPDADGLVSAVPGTMPVIPIPPLPPYNGGLVVTTTNPFASLNPNAGTQFENFARDALTKIMAALKIS